MTGFFQQTSWDVSKGRGTVSNTVCLQHALGYSELRYSSFTRRWVSYHQETWVARVCLKIKAWTSVQCLFKPGQAAYKSVLEGITEHSSQRAGKSPLLVTGTVQTLYIVFMGFSVEGWIQDALASLFMAVGEHVLSRCDPHHCHLSFFFYSAIPEAAWIGYSPHVTVANLQRESQKKLMWSSGLLPGCIWAAAHNDMYNCKGLPKKAGWI